MKKGYSTDHERATLSLCEAREGDIDVLRAAAPQGMEFQSAQARGLLCIPHDRF